MTRASIVIISKNNEEQILNLLETLAQQDFKDFEVIIIDLCSTDKTLIKAKQFPIKAFRLESGEKNLPRALNLASKICLGEIIFSLAGKNVPLNDYFLSSGLKMLEDSQTALTYGPKLVKAEAPLVKILKMGRWDRKDQEVKNANLDACAYKKKVWQRLSFPENEKSAIWEWAAGIKDLGLEIKFNPEMAISSKEKTGLLHYLKEKTKKDRYFNDFKKRKKEEAKK